MQYQFERQLYRMDLSELLRLADVGTIVSRWQMQVPEQQFALPPLFRHHSATTERGRS